MPSKAKKYFNMPDFLFVTPHIALYVRITWKQPLIFILMF